MITIIIDRRVPIVVGGLALAERAALAARRAGLDDIVIVSDTPPARSRVQRLASRGVAARHCTWADIETLDLGEQALVIGGGVVVETRAIAAVVGQSGGLDRDAVAIAGDPRGPWLALAAGSTIASMRDVRSEPELMARLLAARHLQTIDVSGCFVRRLEREEEAGQAETDCIRHLNGRESFFTRKIRRFSVPVSRVLARLGVTPTQVTLAGLLLASGSAMLVSVGTYQASLAGALLYYASMVLDCSDGEVARLSFRDSAFGAWFETIVDYTSYFLLLAGLTIGSFRRYGDDFHQDAAVIALVASLVIAAVASYLRQRVAGADPGQFDDASAAVLRRSTPFHRFARWGRQWIKRSAIAHLVVALALVGQLPFLIYLWAFGGIVASVVIVGVEPFIVRRVKVASPARRP